MKPKRKVYYQVWPNEGHSPKRFSNKADAVYFAALTAIAQDREMFVRGVLELTGKHGKDVTFGHYLIDVYQDASAVQRGGNVRRSRAGFTKYLKGYGKLHKGCLSYWKKWKGKK